VPHHLESVPSDELDEPDFGDDLEPIVRPAWWRWVAIAVIVAMAVAGPFGFALYLLLS
jgi:hypothetical protein